jgi:RNA recognition motif-containing protein
MSEPHRPVPAEPVPTVFIGNLSPETTEDELISAFSVHGKVRSCRIPLDPYTHHSKYVAFLEYEDTTSVQAAVRLVHGTLMHGRPMRVTIGKPQSERPSRAPSRREYESAERRYREGRFDPPPDPFPPRGLYDPDERPPDPFPPRRLYDPDERPPDPFPPRRQFDPDRPFRFPPEYDRVPFHPPPQYGDGFDRRPTPDWRRELPEPPPRRVGLEEAIRMELERRGVMVPATREEDETLMQLLQQIRRQ